MSSLPDLKLPEHSLDMHERSAAGKKTIDFVQLGLDHWKWLAVGGICGIMLGVALYMVLGPTYDATTGVLVRRRAQNVATDNERQIVVFSERGEHIALIKSPLIVQSAVKRSKLDELPSLSGSEDIVEDIIDNVKVERTAGADTSSLNVLGITFTSRNQEDAKKVVTALSQAYDNYLKEEHRESVNETLDVVDNAIMTLEDKLDLKKQKLIEWNNKTPLQFLSAPGADGAKVVQTRHHAAVEHYQEILFEMNLKVVDLATRKQKIAAAKRAGATRAELESMVNEFARIPIGMKESSEATNGQNDSSSTQSEMVKLFLEYRKRVREFGPGHPEVKDLKTQLESLQQIAVSSGDRSFPLKNDMTFKDPENVDIVLMYVKSLDEINNLLTETQNRVETMIASETIKAKEMTAEAIEGEILKDSFADMKNLLSKVETRLEDLNVNNQSGYKMSELSPAKTALNIKRPIKMVGACMVMICGLFYSLLYLRELNDKTVRTADDLRLHLGLSVIGGVPIYEPATRQVMTSSSYPGLDPTLCYAHKPGSLEAESFRSVRTAVLVQAEAEKAQILQVTSAEPGDGKSSIVANLAIALAQSGKKILIVEADLRRPVQQRLFGLEHQVGISEVLSGDVHFQNAIQETVFPGLSIIVAGGECAAPAEMLSSRLLKDALEEARGEYDLILVDTPPLLAVSDPCVTGRYTDGVLLVTRLNKNEYAYLSRATELLQTHGIRLVGVLANGIFNMTNGKAYGYGYGYGDNEPKRNDTKSIGAKVSQVLEPYVSA